MSMRSRPRSAPRRGLWTLLTLAALGVAWSGAIEAQERPASPESLRTAAEESNFTRYTSYEEMMEYLTDLRATSAEFRMGIYG